MYSFTWTSWFSWCLKITKIVSFLHASYTNLDPNYFNFCAKINFFKVHVWLENSSATFLEWFSTCVFLVWKYCSGQFLPFSWMKDEMCAWLWRPSNTNWNQRKIDPFGLLLHSSRWYNNQQHSNKKTRQFDRLDRGWGKICFI